MLVTLGTGIGGGLVIDGRLVRGAHGFAGEPGHMVVDPDGPLCPCGRQGLLGALRLGQRPRPSAVGRRRPAGATGWPDADGAVDGASG